ncbi:hypothetical protein C343_04044 [Cryptococcus neoformans C23]|uniref:GAF domain-containing protein n=2 Tax=Cryptococcus neoformans TaxID=5207 RepID=A0A854Q8K9_CRYNE|nr:hypothetical protein CNAG_06653 [Cryptococcus neoformans var. grubii H99]AUB25799.1 hypothetical protein CKF44_06653 [Cryptococcus neoformans var. grubii]OWZ30953.1 hypothetical protein C347_04105 [Cryptococcus neoformans var. grubii AD2-60a]OWZ43008.1 hypothetical protein C343_04044 [Cryptococcus neoformans var. grubii C23]OXC84027.1 hypothetical protein C344_03801 [Cryptococcus neoformans var. grubii AD1-7a]OXG19308.1 hypothetical protein C361_04253 [Cryptococcus neoformans var. grubii Tu|eukprot:XP_012050305.1 hypothetical protein CNAG_06653 [Cryptococcus neoformans var. grubii H99]
MSTGPTIKGCVAFSHRRFNGFECLKPLISGDNAPGFEELVEKASRTFGFLNLTILAWRAERGSLVRIYSTHPADYPVGGEKVMPPEAEWLQTVIIGQRPHTLWTADEIKRYYNDANEILAMGAGALLCVPVISEGKTLGALNFINKGYTEKDLKAMQELAPRAVASFEQLREEMDVHKETPVQG